MKMIFASLILVLLSAHAFAGTTSITAAERYALPSSTADADCTQIASILSRIATPQLSVSVTENCLLHKHQGEFIRILTRILVDAGSWGINEIVCKVSHDGTGCGPNNDYLSLQATLAVADSNGSFQGQPVSVADCQLYATELSQLTLFSNQAKLTASCTDGMLQTSLEISK